MLPSMPAGMTGSDDDEDPTLCLDSGIVHPHQLHWVKGVWEFRCHLHFWQNDQGLSRATAVALGGGGTDTK